MLSNVTFKTSKDEEGGRSAAGARIGAETHPSCSLPTGHRILLSVYKAIQLLSVCVKLLQGLAA